MVEGQRSIYSPRLQNNSLPLQFAEAFYSGVYRHISAFKQSRVLELYLNMAKLSVAIMCI